MVSWGTNRRVFGSCFWLSLLNWMIPCTLPTLEELVVAQSMSSFISSNSDKWMWGILCVKKTLPGHIQLLRLWCLNFVWNFPWVHTLFRAHRLKILARLPTVNSRYQLFFWRRINYSCERTGTAFCSGLWPLFFIHPFYFQECNRTQMFNQCARREHQHCLNLSRVHRYENRNSEYRHVRVRKWFMNS